MKRSLLTLMVYFAASSANCAFADDGGNWLVSVGTGHFSATRSLGNNGDPCPLGRQSTSCAALDFDPSPDITSGKNYDSTGSMRSIALQYNFEDYFGFQYRRLTASGIPAQYSAFIVPPGYAATFTGPVTLYDTEAHANYSANVFALEAHYQLPNAMNWFEVFVRYNYQTYTVDATTYPSTAFGGTPTPVSFSVNGSEGYLSYGARLHLTRHVGLELSYEAFPEFPDSQVLGSLFVQF